MGEQDRQETLCNGCGRPVTDSGEKKFGRDEGVYCSQCMIDKAEKYINGPAEKPELQQLRGTLAWKAAMVVITLICVGVLIYQVPHVWTAFKEPKPIRMGTYETDEISDKCINNLWKITNLIQQGHPDVGKGLVCPASGKPYLIIPKANMEAHCPNPGSHGFRDILVTKKVPVPELKKIAP
jgi:hypothetical protein